MSMRKKRMNMFKPRGPQKPSFKPTGINPFALIKFLEKAQLDLTRRGELDTAFRIEMLKTYFEEDYEVGKPLEYHGQILGF